MIVTDAELERLAILSEELAEASKAIGKILRYGWENTNPLKANSETNREALQRELGHVQFAIALCENSGDVSFIAIGKAIILKAERIKPWLHHNNPDSLSENEE